MIGRSRFFFMKNRSIFQALHMNTCKPLSAKRFPMLNSKTFFNKSFSTASIEAKSTELSKSILSVNTGSKGKYPPISKNYVGYWLFGTSSLIFGIVVLGGLTRLTESGLSITEWKPITGSIPPLNEAEWEHEFLKYKDSPEFQQLNSHITLEEFKFIYSMEWGHRLMGRAIGMFFILPAIYFWKSKKLSAHVGKRVVGLTGLLGLQGFIGWWMVKSGLDQDLLSERKSKPTVSQYRLTTHLCAAFLMYLGVLWTGFEIINENNLVKKIKSNPESVKQLVSQLNSPSLNRFRSLSLALLGLTFLTAMSGGMVAGLDAGLIYNTFPHMGDDYLPTLNELMSPVFSRKLDNSDLIWRNLLENPTTVQLVHRTLAMTTFFSVIGAHIYANRFKSIIPNPAIKALRTMAGLVTLQATLGISTLIYLVPIPLAAAHQAGALALLTGCLAFASRLKRVRPQATTLINQLIKLK